MLEEAYFFRIMKKIILLLVLGLLSTFSYSQNYLNIRYNLDTINSYPRIKFLSFKEYNNTFYLLGEYWEEIMPSTYRLKSFILNIDKFGNINNRKDIDLNPGSYGDLIVTSDNGFAFAGSFYPDSLTFCRYYPLLDTIVMRYYQFATTNIHFEGRNILESLDGNYLIQGQKFDYNNNFFTDYIIKTDSIGNEIWRKGYPIPSGIGWWITPTTIFETIDYNYITLRTIHRYGQGNLAYEEVTSIEKIDTSGNGIWGYKTPINRIIGAYDGLPTADNGVVFCGTVGEKVHAGVLYRGYIQKVDSLRQMEWEHILGHPENSGLNDIEILSDGSYLASGFDVITYPDSVPINDSDSSRMMGWLVKIAPDGTKLWERHHLKYNSHPLQHIINETHEMANGDLLSVGQNQTSIVTPGKWGWLIRTDSFGCIVPGCQLLDNTENISVIFDNEVTVFPNPASEVVKFRFEKAVQEGIIRVYLSLGQLIDETKIDYFNEVEMNVSDWNNGVYYYGIYVEGQLVKQGQVLVQN